MEPVGTHGLACLGEQDWADYARYMQCQAETIDQVLFEQLTSLEDFLSRPTIMVNRVLDQTFASGTTVSNFYDSVNYVNNSFMSLTTIGTETFINIGSPVGSTVTPYLPGMYMVGAQVNANATGAVTAFSQRNLTINALDDTLSGVPQIGLAFDINPDPNIAALDENFMSCAFTIVLRGTHGVRIGHAISHTNAASTVTFDSDNCLLWVTYLGPNELVEVA